MVGILMQYLFIHKQFEKVKWLTNNAVILHRLNFILPHIKVHLKIYQSRLHLYMQYKHI